MDRSTIFRFITLVVFCCLLLLVSEELFAQCPMCKGAAEQNLKEGGTHALGLNRGILYLFVTPYLLVMTIGLAYWWKVRKAKQAESMAEISNA